MKVILTYGCDTTYNIVKYFVEDKAQVTQIYDYDKKLIKSSDLFIMTHNDTTHGQENFMLLADLVVDEMLLKLQPHIEFSLILGKLKTEIPINQYTLDQLREIWLELL